MKLYIADLHFFQDTLIEKHDKRNFPSGDEMNRYMIERWNNKIRGGDIVIVLGDFIGSKEPEQVNRILHQLKGKICLIEGNHDYVWLNKSGVDMNRFEWVKPYAEFDDHGRTVVASHYPILCYNHQYQLKSDGSPQTYMLYGHVHNTHDETCINSYIRQTRETQVIDSKGRERKIPCNLINCFCMFSDYTPLSLKEWIALDEKRRQELWRSPSTNSPSTVR